MVSLTGSYPNETFPVRVWPRIPSEIPLPPTTTPGATASVPPPGSVRVWPVPVVLSDTVNAPLSVMSGMLTTTFAVTLP